MKKAYKYKNKPRLYLVTTVPRPYHSNGKALSQPC